MDSKQKHLWAIVDTRPQMLKDFLRDDLNNSCSSSGFKSFPRKRYYSTAKNFLEHDHRHTPNSLPRSRSRAAEATVSAIRKLLNAVKSSLTLTSAVDESPLTRLSLTRSPSRRLWRRWPFSPAKPRFNEFAGSHENVKIKVKDILRWRSFRDLIDEKVELNENSQPLDSQTVKSGSTGEFGLTVEALPCRWSGPSDGNKSSHVGGDSVEETTGNKYHDVGPEGKVPIEEREQQSPVSVLDRPFREEDKLSPSFDQSLANIERTKPRLLGSIECLESLEGVETANLDKQFSMEEGTNIVNNEQEEDKQNGAEGRALLLMQCIRASGSKELGGANLDQLLFDFFIQELIEKNEFLEDKKLEDIAEKEAKAHLSRHASPLECEVQDMKDRESGLEDMGREVEWSKFEHEQNELVVNMEISMLNALLDEILFDLLGYS